MVNDRQYYISLKKECPFINWKTIPMEEGWVLHFHSDIKVFHINNNIVLLGYAWQVDPHKDSPEKELYELSRQKQINHQTVYELEKSWCGRYILIVNHWIYMDATGSLGVYYSHDNISCSLNVIRTLEERPFEDPDIQYRKSPDYFPGVLTPYEGVKRLMPSQILDYTKRETCIRPLLVDKIPYEQEDIELISSFSNYFIHSVRNMAEVFSKHHIWFALSGGRDSRATLALFEKAGINFSIFTLWHDFISKADILLPRKIAKTLNRPYRFIERNKKNYSQKRYDEFLSHTASMTEDADWLFYAYGQYQALRENNESIVIVRSGIWETPEEFYTVTFGDKANDVKTLFPGILNKPIQYESTMEWVKLVDSDKINTNISRACRTVWEMSAGCWLSPVEQSFDLMDGIISIQPLNCRLFIGLLLGFNLEDRHRKLHEEKIVSYCCPSIGNIPYDYQLGPDFVQRCKNYLFRIKRIFSQKIHLRSIA